MVRWDMETAPMGQGQSGLARILTIGGAIALAECFCYVAFGNRALAQITPDATLGQESSVVSPNTNVRGLPAELIEGGALRGANLFHSFSQFNVGEGQRVYFANPTGIENILTRVTGNNLSNIFGTLGVDGAASLFLLNPNGIIFGANAKLDIAGSFVASTANRLVFDNGATFSATNPEAPPLLSINLTPGLQYGLNYRGAITNAGNKAPNGLVFLSNQYQPNTALTGDIQVSTVHTGGYLGGFSGNSGSVIIDSRGNIKIPNAGSFRTDSATGNAGDITLIAAGSFSMAGGTQPQLIASTYGQGNAGNVNIVVRNAVSLSGNSVIFTNVESGAVGNAGDINIQAGSLSLTDGSELQSAVIEKSSQNPGGRGNGGDININVRDRALARRLLRFGSNVVTNIDPASGVFTDAYFGSKGNGGNLSINTRQLNVTNGGLVFTGTSPKSAGDGGYLTIITEQLNVSDRGQITTVSTGIGNAGDLAIKATGSMSVVNPDSSVSTSAVGSTGNSGNLSINTGRLNVSDRAEVGTISNGTGNAGNLAIEAKDSMSVSNQGLVSTSSTGAGNGGDLSIRTGRLDVSNGGIDGGLSTVALGTGNAGNLSIVATDSVNVVNQSNVTTSSKQGVAGSLYIETGKLNIRDIALRIKVRTSVLRM
jgi:filamentous hemagglutinin family protein